MMAHVHMQNRAGFERALGKTKRESSMAIKSKDADNDTIDAHFVNIWLHFVNSISPINNAKKQAAAIISITFSDFLGFPTPKNIIQVTQTTQTYIKA